MLVIVDSLLDLFVGSQGGKFTTMILKLLHYSSTRRVYEPQIPITEKIIDMDKIKCEQRETLFYMMAMKLLAIITEMISKKPSYTCTEFAPCSYINI